MTFNTHILFLFELEVFVVTKLNKNLSGNKTCQFWTEAILETFFTSIIRGHNFIPLMTEAKKVSET
jgi:hypothetical protein